MGKKIFVSYKYADPNVFKIDGNKNTTVRNYVDELQSLLDEEDHINKGEKDNQDLSQFKDDTISSKLRDKIYDSSVTIVLISPNMKDDSLIESDQWIPWEISYSLKEHARNERTSKTNAILGIVIPDRNNSYEYIIRDNTCEKCNCTTIMTGNLFTIIRENMFNIKNPTFNECEVHESDKKPYIGECSYIKFVKWADFKVKVKDYIDITLNINEKSGHYNIRKNV